MTILNHESLKLNAHYLISNFSLQNFFPGFYNQSYLLEFVHYGTGKNFMEKCGRIFRNPSHFLE